MCYSKVKTIQHLSFPFVRRLWVRRRASEIWIEISHLLGQCTAVAIRNSYQLWKSALDPHKNGLVFRQTQADMVEEGLRAPCPLLQNCFLLIESERGGVSWHPLVTPSGSIVSIVSPSPVVTSMVLVKLKESHSKTRRHESRKGQVGRRRVLREGGWWRGRGREQPECIVLHINETVKTLIQFLNRSLSQSWNVNHCLCSPVWAFLED